MQYCLGFLLLVQKLNNRIEYIDSGKKYHSVSFDIEPVDFSSILKDLSEKTSLELIDLIINDKNKNRRLAAVYLIGRKGEGNKTTIDYLRKLLPYEAPDIKREALWSLAKLGYKQVFSDLLSFLPLCKSDIERSITSRLLGKIGNAEAILPLLDIYSSYSGITRMSAGLAINELVSKFGINTLVSEISNSNIDIRKTVIWLLSSRANYFTKKETNEIIDTLKNALLRERDPSIKLLIAYNLSLLNIPIGAEHLLFSCLSKTIDQKRSMFFWEEITRFYIYNQKQSSLKIVKKLNKKLATQQEGKEYNAKNILQLLGKLEEIISNIDSIF